MEMLKAKSFVMNLKLKFKRLMGLIRSGVYFLMSTLQKRFIDPKFESFIIKAYRDGNAKGKKLC